MPLRAPTTQVLRYLYSHNLCNPFVSSTYGLRNLHGHPEHGRNACESQRRAGKSRRPYSSITPAINVDAIKTIPPANRGLYDALSSLAKQAEDHINQSQLQLALRGLESNHPIIRIAVLGLGSHQRVRQLVTALLADPLRPRAEWEAYLADENDEQQGDLLIKHGEIYSVDEKNYMVRTISIPSRLLAQNKIEILVQSKQLSWATTQHLSVSTMLRPILQPPRATFERASTLAFPVHKALVFTNGIGGLLALPRDTGPYNSEALGDTVKGVTDVTWTERKTAEISSIQLVNLTKGLQAISELRQSAENSSIFEHHWLGSGLDDLASWLEGSSKPTAGLHPALKHLVEMILQDVQDSIRRQRLSEETAESQMSLRRNYPSLRFAMTVWAEQAHTELRDDLESSLKTGSWRKLKWWQLIWRVDDVGPIAAEVIQQAWLVDAERGSLWIGGRLDQAGLLMEPLPIGVPYSSILHENTSTTPNSIQVKPSTPTTTVTPPATSNLPSPFHTILLARRHLLSTSVPRLQARAQVVLLQALSTSALSAALAALVFASATSISLFEAASIAALGVAISARRLQTLWGKAKAAWVRDVRDRGVEVLREMEDGGRSLIRAGREGRGESEEAIARNKADEVVQEVRAELARLEKGSESI